MKRQDAKSKGGIVNVKAIFADPDLRQKLMVSTLQATHIEIYQMAKVTQLFNILA